VAEHARGKRRDRNEWRVAAVHQRGVVRQRHLGGVELLVLQHAPEDLRRLQRDVIEVDALRLDRSVPQRLRAVVGPAGQGQSQVAHSHAPVSLFAAQTVGTRRRIVNAARRIADRRAGGSEIAAAPLGEERGRRPSVSNHEALLPHHRPGPPSRFETLASLVPQREGGGASSSGFTWQDRSQIERVARIEHSEIRGYPVLIAMCQRDGTCLRG